MILSYKEINSIANNIIKQYETALGKPIDRVDIVDLLKRLYGVSVEYYTLSQNNKVLGIASPSDTAIQVWKDEQPVLIQIGLNLVLVERSLLDPKLNGRRNFTVAHEGAHQILLRMEPNKEALCLRKTPNNGDYHLITQNDWEEWQANTLASCLLMPELQVKRMFWLLFSENRVNLIMPENRNVYLPFVAMADFFGVSKEALAIRLKQLKLIGEFKLERTIAYVNPMDIFMTEVV